jgi:subtilisin inhibitor-like
MAFSVFAPVAASVVALAAAPGQPATDLALAVQHGPGPAASVSLGCEPASGTHPDPAGACRTLSIVDGDFSRLPHENTACPDLWDPVSATATGHWRGRPVQFDHTYPNKCLADAESSGVFSF